MRTGRVAQGEGLRPMLQGHLLEGVLDLKVFWDGQGNRTWG